MLRLWKWFTDRWPYYALKDLLLKEDIPGGASFAYTLGTTLIMLFTLQIVSGILQLFYYVPTTDHAYNSVNYLRTEVPFGWLIHNMHYWGAQAMVLVAALHMVRVYVWGAYKKTPLTWFFGVGQILVIMAISFTGAPLIWDQAGYWAGEVGSSIAGEVPVAGDLLKTILRGGPTMGQLALSRFFVFHIAVFVPLLGLLVAMHIASFRMSGVGGPWDEKKRRSTGPLWPDQIFKDMMTATLVFLFLIALSVYFPVPFAGLADTLNTSYVPKPEWNFLFVYQALKYFKGPWEPIGAAGVPAAFVFLLIIVPLIDRNPERNPFRRPVAMTCLVLYAGLVLALTVAGYLSPGFAQPAASSSSAQSPQSQGKQQEKPAEAEGQKPPESPQQSAAIEKGKKVFQSQGCSGCHKVNGQGGSTGPELSGNTLNGKSRKWLEEQIRNPKSHFPNTIMPSFSSLGKEELDNLVSYLMSLAGGSQTSGGSPASGKSSVSGSKQGKQEQAKEGTESAPQSSAMERGMQVFQSSGCKGCHKVHGEGGAVGPELAGDTLKGKSKQWIIDQITKSSAHFPSMGPNTGMTEFTHMGKQDLNDLAAYLMSLASGWSSPGQASTEKGQKETEGQTKPPGGESHQTVSLPSSGGGQSGVPTEEKAMEQPAGEAAFIIGSAENGADLYKEQCASCHGPDGKGGVQNPGSAEGTVPALNPIPRDMYDSNPKVFAEKIDKIIQHGAMPEGPNPALHMPAWGDSRSLTQQEIANIEAYILKLNGVDRGKLIHPGMEPQNFFFAVLGVFIIVFLLMAGYWSKKKEG